ncbi:MAG: DUF6968 family protein [Gemmatimonadales bacterium]
MAAFAEARFRVMRDRRRVRDVVVRISAPRRTRTGEWVCVTQATGITKRTKVHGVDALQALCIAVDFLDREIYKARKRGLRLAFDTGDQVPLYAYFRLRESHRRLARVVPHRRSRAPV